MELRAARAILATTRADVGRAELALRDRCVDWNPEDRSNAVGDGLTVGQLKSLAWFAMR